MPRLVFVGLFLLAALLPVWLFGLFSRPVGPGSYGYMNRPMGYGYRHGGWIYRSYGGGGWGGGHSSGGTFRGGGPHFGK